MRNSQQENPLSLSQQQYHCEHFIELDNMPLTKPSKGILLGTAPQPLPQEYWGKLHTKGLVVIHLIGISQGQEW